MLEFTWHTTAEPQSHEATLLYLDSAKAKSLLGWRPVWTLDVALAKTVEWYRSYYNNGSAESLTQLAQFIRDARSSGLKWSGA